MRLRRAGIAGNIVIVAVVVILAAGIGDYAVTAPKVPLSAYGTTSTNSSNFSVSGPPASSNASAQGVRLIEAVNSSTLFVGQRLNVIISMNNTLPAVNNVLPSNDWQFQGVPVDLWPACYYGLPAEAVVLDGNYSLQDLRSAANVTIAYDCMEDVSVDHVIFQPGSDRVNLTGIYDVTGANQTLGPFQLEVNFTTAGYWNLTALAGEVNAPIIGQSQSPEPAYTAFTPGVYTVAVADEWGQAVVLHVTVVAD